jgi:membrane-associated phospholipid phosphatase
MPRPERRLLIHEYVFGAFLLVMWLRLVVAQGPNAPPALVYLAALVVNAAVVGWSHRDPSLLRWRMRLLFYPLAMNVLFQHMRVAIPAVHPARLDAQLLAIDEWLLGATPAMSLEPWIRPWLTDVMSFCYFLFLPYLALSMLYYFLAPLPLAQRFWAGLFTLYGIGFLGYSLVPAAGPWVYLAGQFTVPLTGGWITDLNARVIGAGSNGVDVFPSLHCAVSAYCLFFDLRHKRWRFVAYVVPCVGLWLSTVYLRYHYLIDLVAGFVLAVVALEVAGRFRPASIQSRGAGP